MYGEGSEAGRETDNQACIMQKDPLNTKWRPVQLGNSRQTVLNAPPAPIEGARNLQYFPPTASPWWGGCFQRWPLPALSADRATGPRGPQSTNTGRQVCRDGRQKEVEHQHLLPSSAWRTLSGQLVYLFIAQKRKRSLILH